MRPGCGLPVRHGAAVGCGRVIGCSKDGKISVCYSFCGRRAPAGANLETDVPETEYTASHLPSDVRPFPNETHTD